MMTKVVSFSYPAWKAFAPNRHLVKKTVKAIGADETAQFMVIEFDRNENAS